MNVDPWRVLTTYSRDVAYIADAEGCLSWLSDALPRVLGWRPDDLLGRPLRELVHPDDLEAAMAWRALLRARPAEADEAGVSTDPLRFRCRDGSYLWCTVSAARVIDEAGAIVGITGSVHDVDDLVRARISAAEAHDLLRRVIDAQVDPHVILRAVRDEALAVVDVRYEDVNDAAARFEGRAREELVGSTILAIYADRDEALSDVADCATALASGQPLVRHDVVSREYRDAEGSPVIVDLTIVPIDGDRVSYMWRDVTERHRSREQVQQAHGLLRRVIDAQVDPHVILRAARDDDGSIVDFVYLDANEAAADYEGLPREDMVGALLSAVYHDPVEAREDIADCVLALDSGRPVVRNDARTLGYLDALGRPIVTDNRIVRIDDDLVSYTWRDVTERHAVQQALTESEERFRLLAENMTDVVVLIRNVTIVWVSPSVSRSLGWTPDELVGQSPAVFTHPDDVVQVMSRWQQVPSGALPRQRYRLVARDGAVHWVDGEGSIITGGESRTVVVTARIVDAEVAALRSLEDMARHDELTGLVNRHAVFDQVSRSLQGEMRSGTRLAMVFCDLDGFKAVNDTYGHTAGDVLLRSIARRLERAVRSVDVVARIGGDELLIVLNGVHDLDDAVAIAEKIRAEVRQPTVVPGGVVTVSASVGVAIAEAGEHLDDIVARADRAMYDAKRSGKDRVIGV